MPTGRESPYAAFNYLVEFDLGTGREPFAGFSEVSGLGIEIAIAEFRAGNDPIGGVRRIPGVAPAGEVALKRGVVGFRSVFEWVDSARRGGLRAAKKNVVVKLLSENRDSTLAAWTLRNATPLKWIGPSSAAMGGADVAVEELTLSVEAVELE